MLTILFCTWVFRYLIKSKTNKFAENTLDKMAQKEMEKWNKKLGRA